MSDTGKPKIIMVVGPTASGKTSLAIELAQHFNGEVISADSRQVYRGLDIGTAKVTKEEMLGIPHHLLDIVAPNEVYNAADFVRDAKASIADITTRGKLPVIAGGTFFYIDALLDRTSLPAVPPNPELRAELEAKETAELVLELTACAPERAATIDTKNRRRLIRALEIWNALKDVPKHIPKELPYEVLTIGLAVERELLRERYRVRGQEWLTNGFENEVLALLNNGISRERLQEIGFEYQLMLLLIDGELTESDFVERFVEKNWQYAKRQLTWLKRDQSIQWFTASERPTTRAVVENFLRF